MDYLGIATVTFAVWNFIVFIIYGADKGKAKRGSRRISEKTLLTLAAFMGGLGALFGMYVFRHKTKHAKFKFGVPLLLALNIAIAIVGVKYINLAIADIPVEYQKITPGAAKEIMDSGGAVILDVRTAEEYEDSHIPGAVLLPDTEIIRLAAELLPDKKQIILLYCRTGRRSKNAAEVLIEMGYTKVYDFGGVVDWPYEMVINE